MKHNYPMYNNGLVGVIDYSKLIKMQSQQPIGKISGQEIKLHEQLISNNTVFKRSFKKNSKKVR